MKNLLLSCAAILFCCFNFVNAQGCQECAETGGFYCGNDTANWTEYSPNGCVPSYYINDGYADCLDGGDEVVGAETDCDDEEVDGCFEAPIFDIGGAVDGFYMLGDQIWISNCSYYECLETNYWELLSLADCITECEECANSGGFYCGDDESNWTEYSPDGCVPSYYINDGYTDCLDGGDEVAGAETNCEEEGCWEEEEFYCLGCELFISECTYVVCEGPDNWSDIITIDDCEDGCYDDMGEFYPVGEEWWGTGGCEYSICEEGGSWSDVIDDCSGVGCIEGEELYEVGYQLFSDECNYFECLEFDLGFGMYTYFWSEIITIDDCGQEEGCWEEDEFYCIGCELFIDDCTYVECEGPNNWSNWIEIADCGGGVDCVDDPDGMVAEYGSSCSELAILGCDADLSEYISGIGFGISVYEICPESCTDCGQEEGCVDDMG